MFEEKFLTKSDKKIFCWLERKNIFNKKLLGEMREKVAWHDIGLAVALKTLALNKKTQEKMDWFSSMWHLKVMIDRGLLKGLSSHDYSLLKFVNLTYNRSQKNKITAKIYRFINKEQKKKRMFEMMMFGDSLLQYLSDDGFEIVKDIWKKNKDKLCL